MASYDEAIPPGQVGKINATLKTSAYRGAVSKTIAVTTNDPALSSLTLTLKVRVVGSVELLPIPNLAVSIGGPEARPGRLLIRKDATETGSMKIGGLSMSVPWLEATARLVTEPGPRIEGLPEPRPGDVVIEVAGKGEAPEPGSFPVSLSFETGLPREPKVTIPVYVHIRAPLMLGTKDIVLQPGVEGIVLVGVRRDVDIEKVTATAEPAAFKATLERANATTLRLKIALDAAADPAPSVGSVTLLAGDASATVQVRVVR